MADQGIDAAKSVSAGGDNLIATAKKRMKVAMSAYSDSRESELDDLRFYAASPDTPDWQWPSDVMATRGAVSGQTINARPCLVINKLPQHVKQVTNDQRQNRPAGKVIPVDDKADPEVAEILNGIVRHIEYISDADVADDTACENQVAFGEGYFRILTEYCDENSFDQEIKIGRIRNSFSVYMDPTIQDPCGADANWCFITQEMTHEEFQQEFPKATPISSLPAGIGDDGLEGWMTEKTVRVAEYFYFENKKKELGLFPPVPVMGLAGGSYLMDSMEAEAYKRMGINPMKKRDTTIRQVKWAKINGFEVLESGDWPGKWIPVVRVVGNEYEIEGQLYLSGLIRNAKDAQRMYNYWASQETEMLALAPKAPFIGYGGQFEGYEAQWKTANINNWPYLEVNPDAADPEGKPYPLPQRAMPPLPQAGIIQAKMGAADDIKGTTGQYDPSLGAESNEKSGKAIIARERQADVGTYHYVDNLARAVRYRTRQIIDLIPKIYDTQRIARIVGLDGEVDRVKIDPSIQTPVQAVKDEQTGAVIEKIYNPSIGKYDVAVTTGPSYMTKRQEAADAMVQILQGNPGLWQVAGDLLAKNFDWPGAEELAKRLAKMVPPELRDDEDDSPEMAQAKQVIQQLQQQMQAMQSMLENVGKSMEYQKAANDHMKNEIGIYQAETDRIKAMIAAFSAQETAALAQQTAVQALNNPELEQEESGFMEEQEPAHQGMT